MRMYRSKATVIITGILVAAVFSILVSCSGKEKDKKDEIDIREIKPAPTKMMGKEVPPPQPFPEEPQVTRAMLDSAFDIVSTQSFPGPTTDSGAVYRWAITLRNKLDRPISLKARLRWLGDSNSVVKQVIKRGMKLNPHEEKPFTGKVAIESSMQQPVKSFKADVTLELKK